MTKARDFFRAFFLVPQPRQIRARLVRFDGCAQHGANFLSCLMYHARLMLHCGICSVRHKAKFIGPSSPVGADSCILLPEASFEVSRPADRGSAITFASASQHINEKSISCFAAVSHGQILFVPQRELAAGRGRSHSCSFDHRRRPEMLRTAIATAFFCPTSTTSFLPRVTPV